MARDRDHAGAARLGETDRLAEAGAGLDRRRKPLGRDAEVIEGRPRPLRGMDVQELRGAGDRKLVLHPAREEEVEVVGQEQASARHVGDARAAAKGFLELQARVVEHRRNAGGGVDAVEGGPCPRQSSKAWLGTGVPVGVDRIDEPALLIDQAVVHAPRVDSDGRQRRSPGQGLHGLSKACLDFGPKRSDLPIVPGTYGFEGVGEAVDFRSRDPVAVPRAQDDAPAGGTEVDGGRVEWG